MAGPNLTGRPQTTDYVLGRGRLHVGEIDATTGLPIHGYRDLGNVPEFTLTVETESLEHISTRAGLAVVDKEVTTSIKLNGSFTLDEVNFENLSEFLLGTQAAYSNTAAASAITGADNLTVYEHGRWYDLHAGSDGTGVRLYDISGFVLMNEDGMTTYVEGTDYLVDLVFGRVFIIPGAGVALDASGGTVLEFDTGINASADQSFNEVRALLSSPRNVALLFIQENPGNNDQQYEWVFHSVQLRPEGDMPMISEDWQTMGFSFIAGTNSLASVNSPTLTIRTHDNAQAA